MEDLKDKAAVTYVLWFTREGEEERLLGVVAPIGNIRSPWKGGRSYTCATQFR